MLTDDGFDQIYNFHFAPRIIELVASDHANKAFELSIELTIMVYYALEVTRGTKRSGVKITTENLAKLSCSFINFICHDLTAKLPLFCNQPFHVTNTMFLLKSISNLVWKKGNSNEEEVSSKLVQISGSLFRFNTNSPRPDWQCM